MTQNNDALKALDDLKAALPTGIEYWDNHIETIRKALQQSITVEYLESLRKDTSVAFEDRQSFNHGHNALIDKLIKHIGGE